MLVTPSGHQNILNWTFEYLGSGLRQSLSIKSHVAVFSNSRSCYPVTLSPWPQSKAYGKSAVSEIPPRGTMCLWRSIWPRTEELLRYAIILFPIQTLAHTDVSTRPKRERRLTHGGNFKRLCSNSPGNFIATHGCALTQDRFSPLDHLLLKFVFLSPRKWSALR